MAPSSQPVRAYLFGPFRLSVDDRILERNGERVLLTPKVIDTLFVLVENGRQVVTKDALMKAVWPDVTVVESGLTRNISALRKALEEGMPEGSYIETIPRRGYRFIAEIAEEYEPSPVPPAEAEPAGESPVPVRRSRFLMLWPATAVTIVAIAGLSLYHMPSRPATRQRVEPRVRIGEHFLYKLTPDQVIRARDQFEQAISAAPHSAAAHAGLSIALVYLSTLGVQSSPEVAERSHRAATRALELDPGLGAAHYARASVDLVHRWEFDKADNAYRRSLELEPDSVESRFGYAQLKFARGEVHDAIRLTEEALQLDPASPAVGTRYCQAFYYARDFHRAEAECRKVLDREPRYALAHYYLALSQGFLGRIDEARASLNATELLPGVLEADHAWLSARAGDQKPALDALSRRRQLIAAGDVNASAKLLLCVILGRSDEAFEAVDSAVTTRAVEVLTFAVDPRLDALRRDPRYDATVRRIGLRPRA